MDGITLAKHLALVSTYSSEQVLLVIGEKKKLVFPQGHADRWVEGVLPEESSKKKLLGFPDLPHPRDPLDSC